MVQPFLYDEIALTKGEYALIITYLEILEKAKVKVYIDGVYAFLLYQPDIHRYHLEEDMELSEEKYRDIIENTVYRRAKQKAIAILKFMNRTEDELRSKLKSADYSDYIVNRTLDYVMEYGYVDDERFTSTYIRTRKNVKSKRQLKAELNNKGIKKDLIDKILSIEYELINDEDPEDIAIRKAIAKKTKGLETQTPEEKQKLLASLYRKGFQFDKIKKILK